MERRHVDIAEALLCLGAGPGTLTAEEKARLDRDGFLRIEKILSQPQVDAVNKRLAELLVEEGEEAGKEVHKEAGTDRLADLINKGDMFHPMIHAPRVLAAIAHVLGGDVKLSTLNSRAALSGQGGQGLHTDGTFDETGRYLVCNSIWLLDDFTEENGATRLVPGSHKIKKPIGEVLKDPAAPHPDQVLALGKAGDVFVFNSHTWHGGTINHTNRPRRSITAYCVRRHMKQFTDQRKHLLPETRPKLSEATLVFMDAV